MRNLLKVALVLSALAPASAFAQGQLRYDGDVSSNGTLGGASVGPYQGDLSGFSPTFADDSNVILWCVDWNHAAPTQQTWDTYAATAFNGGDFSATRAASAYKYQKAAWLIEQYEANVSGYIAKNDPALQMNTLTDYETFNGSMGMAKDKVELAQKVAAAMDELRAEGKLAEIFTKYGIPADWLLPKVTLNGQ